jgi:hypothetical protein
MKQILFACCACLCTGARAQHVPAFKPLRYNEDYSSFRNDTNLTWYEKTKFTTLSKSKEAYVSFGGEVRYRYFNIKNEDWGDAPADKDGFVLSRLLLHSDWHFSKHIRTFIQVQSSMANGKLSGASPVDENPLEVHQAFVDISDAKKKLIVRLGRQELSYGSQRLVSVRELPNNRQSFDAAKLILSLLPRYQIDLFFSRYVSAAKGIFDDRSNRDIHFWGAYLAMNMLPVLKNVDLYYLGLDKKLATFQDGSNAERRHSVGARIWNSTAGWRYDLEGVYQFGKFGNSSINAFTASANINYKLKKLLLHPELGLKSEIISGDKTMGDDKLQTFNPLFPRGAYFGLAALIGPANLYDVHPSILFDLWNQKLNWSVDYDVFWRFSKADGIYAPNVALIYSSNNSTDAFIGQQFSTDVSYAPNPFLFFRTEITLFKPGGYLKSVSAGKKLLFVGITSQLKF